MPAPSPLLLCLPALLLAGAGAMQGPQPSSAEQAIEQIASHTKALEGEADLDPLLARIGDARLVLLGEATHGTAEFYTWRAAISRRLVAEKGFAFIAVEGDWADCYELNLYVRGLLEDGRNARDILAGFERWPTWMWANEEVAELVEWLKAHNDALPPEERSGFYGFDLYGAGASKREVLRYLERVDEDAAAVAADAYACLAAYSANLSLYTRALAGGAASCEQGPVTVLEALRERAEALRADDPKAFFNAKQNAYTVKSAERHHRKSIQDRAQSWNRRAEHFHGTTVRLLERFARQGGGIVWAHNTHIGDARATPMSAAGMLNIGRLAREHLGEQVVSVGFGMGEGRFLAGRSWGEPVRTMSVRPPIPGSIEDFFRRAGIEQGLLIFKPSMQEGPLAEVRPHRAVGVTFDPRNEHQANYVPTRLTPRYDAFVYLERTTPLRALGP